MRRSLPVYPGKQTSSEPVGTSHLCHNRSFRHARDPVSLGQSFDIFCPTKWGKVLDAGNALGGGLVAVRACTPVVLLQRQRDLELLDRGIDFPEPKVDPPHPISCGSLIWI